MELMGQIDLMKSITPQEIESYLIEGSCKITQYKKTILFISGKSARSLRLFSLASGIERIDE